jgi:hypothetical protein
VILVYKTTLNIYPSAFRDIDDPSVGWKTGSSTAMAWMVIDVNLADPNSGNIQAALIPFGYGTDPNDGIVKKVYVNDSVLNVNVFSILPGLEPPSAEARPDVFLVDFTADNIAAKRAGVGIVAARMQGTVNMTTNSWNEDDEDDDDDRDEDRESWTETGDVAVLLRGVAVVTRFMTILWVVQVRFQLNSTARGQKELTILMVSTECLLMWLPVLRLRS